MAQKSVHCHHCGRSITVSTRAFSVNCPGCNRRISVEDINILSNYAAAHVETAGSVVVGPEGTLRARVKTKNFDLQGQLVGNVEAQEKVTLDSGAKVYGDIKASRLQVDAGAKITGFCQIEPDGPNASDPNPESAAKSQHEEING